MTSSWISDYVDSGDFTGLFVEELGWNRPGRNARTVSIQVEDNSYTLTEAASYKGLVIWVCPTLPPSPAQRAIDRQLRGESAERVVIFHDGHRQVWRWPQARDTAGSGAPRLVAHEHAVGRQNEALRQRLNFIKIEIGGPELTVIELVRRLRRAFDSEKVTKSFYSKFAQQHRDLTKVIEGIAVSDAESKPELRWYGSILLNRLMFIYFMQRKGFLDGDQDYLRNRLQKVRELKRPGSFYEFYRDFLVPLFHEGLGADNESRAIQDPAIKELIGDIPYINGGIFSQHPLEVANTIRVPDEAFERMFDFFDQWQWHLDDRPTGNPNEINPDVLGYIFEQFVNNRDEAVKGNKDATANADKGAYYTREDVTGYITSNTLVPVFIDRLVEKTGVNPWRLVTADPERYIWQSVRHGCEHELPAPIEAEGQEWPRPSWDELAVPEEFGLPGESWWEVVERRAHALDLRTAALAGQIRTTTDAVAANLDLELLAVDLIDALDNPHDVLAAWEVLSDTAVIDPTCGSGAFLFASLNILHGLYRAILEAAVTHEKTTDNMALSTLVDASQRHPNIDYFLLKHAALRNIYGVDIMPEAVEIARLRLFLKLIAQIDEKSEIEPLPDLEFNIRAGNALVGALDVDDMASRIDLFNRDDVDRIRDGADRVAAAYRAFAAVQQEGDHRRVVELRGELRELSGIVRDQLNTWWHQSDEPGSNRQQYESRVQPFHWFIEFPEVFARGGFDVVVGNPPYVQKQKVPYVYRGFATDACPDIYAACTERAGQIGSDAGRLGMIVMLSLSFSDDFKALRRYLRKEYSTILASNFSRRPSTLFTGAGVRSTIVICSRDSSVGGESRVLTTDTRRWIEGYRPHLMACLRYTDITSICQDPGDQWLRTGDREVAELLSALFALGGSVANSTARRGPELGFKQTALYYLSVYVDEPPAYDADHRPIPQPKVGRIAFKSERHMLIASALLAGRLAYAWWGLKGDDFDVTSGVLKSLPVDLDRLPDAVQKQLLSLAQSLREALPGTLVYTLYAKKWLGNYDMKMARAVTDEFDRVLLETFGLQHFLPVVRRVDARLFRSSGDAGNSIRTWPPPTS